MRQHHRALTAALVLSAAVLLSASFATNAYAQTQSPTKAYVNPNLPAKVRAEDLVSRMTLQEKASQLVNGARAIPSLNVPAYNWWSESLHGFRVNGSTEFPEPIGLGATFDPSAIRIMGKYISLEARVVHEKAVAKGKSTWLHGLDLWSPNINIVRDPRWGRGQETYGEDPFLTGKMAVAYITGMQGSNPKYYRVIATPKHFDAHSGPEPTRHFADVDISKHDLEDTYLPAFRAAIVQGHAGSIMCSYNAVNGQPACANQFLLDKTLRQSWGFKGYVVSDCNAVHFIYYGHHYRPTLAQSKAISVERGMDNECAESHTPTGDSDYKPYITAVQQGYLSESAIDQALVRLFTARIKLGLFAPKGADPYADIPYSELNSPAHRAFARKLANESMVLLKNDGTLPIKPNIQSIAVVGPLADQTRVLLGNYTGIPTHTVSILEGLKAEFPHSKITYVPGTQFLNRDIVAQLIPSSMLTTPDGKPGLKAEYSTFRIHKGALQSSQRAARLASDLLDTRNEPNVDLSKSNLPAEVADKKGFEVDWSGYLTPTKSGAYLIGVRSTGSASVTVNDRSIHMQYLHTDPGSALGYVRLQKGVRTPIRISYRTQNTNSPMAQLIWTLVNNKPSPAAVEAAKNADLVIAVVGITSQLESEQSNIDQPGFFGGDKTNLQMPEPEEALVQAVAATGKPVVAVLLNGSALAVNWMNEHVNAILEAWYPGEEGGAAVADTLSGKNNPAGRLDETFYRSVNQLPLFEDYSMQGRTYRYFDGKPLYPFGYGLSYTTFAYSHLSIPHPTIEAGQPLDADVTVTNTGKVAGDEVVQLYLKFPPVAGAPNIALRGFQRIHLNPGQSQQVQFKLNSRALSMVTSLGQTIVAPGDYTMSIGGGQPGTVAPTLNGHFHINGQIDLAQ